MTSKRGPSCVDLLRRILAGALLLLGQPGCGGNQAPESVVADAEASVAEGAQAIKNGDFAAAEKALTNAINRGTLRADLFEVAQLNRARARIGLQDFDGAKSDLDALDQGAADMDKVWVVRGELLQKQGDEAGAKKAFAEAKKLNPKVVLPN